MLILVNISSVRKTKTALMEQCHFPILDWFPKDSIVEAVPVTHSLSMLLATQTLLIFYYWMIL